MQNAREPSVEELRDESERSRAALAATVRQLQKKVGSTTEDFKTLVSPANIKSEVRSFVREERQDVVDTIRRKAKDNPLQAAAIGAALAYPAWNILRALPTPLMLIGAGLFLTSQRGQQAAQQMASKIEDTAGRVAEDIGAAAEKVADMKDRVVSDIEDRVAGARYGLEEARDTLVSGAEEVTDKARRSIHDLQDAVGGTAKTASEGFSASADSLGANASNAAADLRNTARGAMPSQASVVGFFKENALLLAGAGAVVGAFIAASIPPSQAENRLFGEGSETLKGKAREAAAKGIESVSDIAAGAAGSMAAAASREGLDATGIKGTLDAVADRVRTVADRGLDTALNSKTGVQPVQKGNAS